MKDINQKKLEIESVVRNTFWENSESGLTYKFQNESDLWVNGNGHFNYKIEIVNDKIILKLHPNGQDFFIELKYGEILCLHDDKQYFELRLRNRQ